MAESSCVRLVEAEGVDDKLAVFEKVDDDDEENVSEALFVDERENDPVPDKLVLEDQLEDAVDELDAEMEYDAAVTEAD